MKTAFVVAMLLAVPALAQADFDTANRQQREQSHAKACESFGAFLKANPTSPLAREAQVKKAFSCWRGGRGGDFSELQKFANQGEKDFPRAWASAVLTEQGYVQYDTTAPLLRQALGAEGRQATEARALLIRITMTEIERNTYNRARVEKLVPVVLELSTSVNEKAHARYLRATGNLQEEKTIAAAEKEFTEIGAENSEWADDALYQLGQRRETTEKYTAALEIYDGISKRFSGASSNMKGSAESRAAEIRRKYVSVSTYNIELAGMKPKVQVRWRNVKNAKWTLKKVNPFALNQSQMEPRDPRALAAAGTVVSTWTSTLDVKVPYAPGSTQFDLDVREPGVYVVEVEADGEHGMDRALVTQTATLTKTDRNQVMVWVADVETGVAQPNAEVRLWRYVGGQWNSESTTTDTSGLARFAITTDQSDDTMYVWSKSGPSWSYAQAGNWYAYTYNLEHLAYVLTDRPLYKPGETVGGKLFVRSRQDGPTVPVSGKLVRLQVSDPTGKKVLDETYTTSELGTVTFSIPLPKNAGLGEYRAYVTGADVSYSQLQYGFRVEEYKPPESTVSVEPVGSAKPGERVKFKVKATYFSGGPVANASGRAVVRVTGWSHQWGAWPDAKGDDEASDGSSGDDEVPYYRRRRYMPYYGQIAAHTLLFKTGADGSAEVEVPAPPAGVTQSMQYQVQVYVTDSSRREISGSGSVKVSDQAYFVDVRASHYLYRPGEKVSLQLRAEDANGRKVDPELIVRLVRIAENGSGGRIAETTTRLKAGVGAVQLDADALGMVRVEVQESGGQPESKPVLAQTDLWLTSDTKPIAPPSSGFQVYLDRAPIKVGQPLRALVVSQLPGGHALLTLEHESLHLRKVVELAGRAKFVELPMTAELAPNAWLVAERFEDSQHFQQTYPVRISGSEVELSVGVKFDATVAEPGSKVSATIDSKRGPVGQKQEVALSVVDESIFSIAPERTDFMSYFGRHPRQHSVRTQATNNDRTYARRPKVQAVAPIVTEPMTRDRSAANEALAKPSGGFASGPAKSAPAPAAEALADDAAPASRKKDSAREERKVASDEKEAPGGAAGFEDVKVRQNFSTTAGWYAALSGKVNEPLKQSVTLTDSLTSWRAIATVVTNGPHLGQGRATMRTAKPLMVRLQAPRFFIENDEVTISAVIESHLSKPTDVDVAITAQGFKELSPGRKTLRVEPGQIIRFDTKYKVVDLGERVVRAMVKGGGSSDAMEWKLPALVHGSAQRQFFSGRLKDSFSFSFELPEKRKPSLTQLELVLSPSLLSVMLDGLPYLAQYPYGCVEQTLSRFVPATVARRAVKDLGLPSSRVPADLDDMISKGLERLYGFQHSDGGWGWWQSDSTNDWMTAYVVYALSLARESGLNVTPEVIARGREYLTSHLGAAQNDPETHVFMVFALTQTGKAPKQSLDKVFERRTGFSPRARALVALSLLNAKDPRARIAVENLDDIVKAAQARQDAAVGDANDIWSTSAAMEATAFTLMAMERYDLKSPLIAPLTDFLVLRRNGGKWRTTRDTAFAIYALSDLAMREGATTKAGSFVVFVNGKEFKRLSFSKGGLDLAPLTLPDSALKPGTNVIEVKRDASGTGYFAATFDVFNQNDFIKGVGGDVKVKRTYTLLGKPSAEKGNAPTEYGMPVESGTRVRVDVELTANKPVEFVMIEDLKPAGFEAVMTRSGPEVCSHACAHAELRTDRVAMFMSQIPVGVTRVSYELRAEVPGRFAGLPARVEAMYAPEIQATSDEMRFEVRDEPTGGVAAH